MFVSDKLPTPPSCSMMVKAENNAKTKEVFYYPVPLHGVKKPQQIFIYLSKGISNPDLGNSTYLYCFSLFYI